MKTIAGACFRASRNSFRMRAAPRRAITPTAFQRSQACRTRIAKNASGSHVVAKFAAFWNQCPPILSPHRQQRGNPLAEGGDQLLGGRELDAPLPPDGLTSRGSRLVEAAPGVLHEANPPPSLPEAAGS